MVDLDDTLVERPPLFRAWASAFLAEHAMPAGLVDRLVVEDRGGHRPRREFLEAVAGHTGYAGSLDELAADHDDRLGGSYRLTPEVRAALDDVRRAGWHLAVITNGPVARQSTKIRATGLEEIADAVCISHEVGVDKPDPLIFRTAAARAGCTLEGAWMVGDNLDADIAGAQGVGARAAWIKRDEQWIDFHSGAEPDLVARSFPDAVRRLLDATAG